MVEQREALPAALAPLPAAVMDPPPEIGEWLAAFGVRCVGEALALPRASLARRLGRPFAEDIERALGERPDPRAPFAIPRSSPCGWNYPSRRPRRGPPAFAARRLIEALCGWPHQRQAGITGYTLRLDHGRGTRHPADTRLEVRCASPTRDPERLARELLARMSSRLPSKP